MRHPPALRRDLLLRLSLPLLVIFTATGALGLYTAQTLTDRTFDRWLLDGARALAMQVRFVEDMAVVDLGGDAEAILAYDVVDSTYFSVEQQSRHVAGHHDLPRHGKARVQYDDGLVFDSSYAGRPVRVAEVSVGHGNAQAQVRVAETLSKRHGIRADLQLMLLPLAALLLAAVGAIVLALRWTLQPLELIAARWNERSHASLETIELHGVPRELLPFATALNDLLARIHQLLLRERRFAANAAHQIRTPLAGLQLGLARAAEAPDLAATRTVINELQQTTQRAARSLQQLLSMGRLDPETAFDLAPTAVDLVSLAHEVGALYLDSALARNTVLELLAPEQAVTVQVRAELISEALGNLVDNALRYAPPGSRVEIIVRAHPPTLVVTDSGPGLAAHEREAMLSRYVRGQDAPGDGSGLGLAIVREIAELHRIRLTLTDSALGGLEVSLCFQTDAPAVHSQNLKADESRPHPGVARS